MRDRAGFGGCLGCFSRDLAANIDNAVLFPAAILIFTRVSRFGENQAAVKNQDKGS